MAFCRSKTLITYVGSRLVLQSCCHLRVCRFIYCCVFFRLFRAVMSHFGEGPPSNLEVPKVSLLIRGSPCFTAVLLSHDCRSVILLVINIITYPSLFDSRTEHVMFRMRGPLSPTRENNKNNSRPILPSEGANSRSRFEGRKEEEGGGEGGRVVVIGGIGCEGGKVSGRNGSGSGTWAT